MDILNIFYQEIIPEASCGSIKSFFTYNVIFDTLIKEENNLIKGKEQSNGVVIPLLIINNKSLFDKLLVEYVNLALEFYQDSKYLNEIKIESQLLDENIDVRKNILAVLWSNATFDDFNNPIEFLQKRIKFLNSEIVETTDNYGYVPVFNGELEISIQKDEIYNETPYLMHIRLYNAEGLEYSFPEIKFRIYDNTLYGYAIQNKENAKNSYEKKINRLLYKVNDGFDELKDLPEIYGIGNLKDISASFLVSLNIALSYFKNLGITKVISSSILLTRWNAKRMAILKSYAENDEKYILLTDEQIRIQHNLTEKFLRTFLRLKVHYKDIEVLAYPFDIDSNLHMDISNMNISNNELLQVSNDIISNNKNKNL